METSNTTVKKQPIKIKYSNPAFHSVRKYNKDGVEQKVDLILELDKERVQYNKKHGTNFSYTEYKMMKQGINCFN